MTTREDFDTRFTQMGKEIDDMLADEREEYREERKELKDKWNRLEERRTEMNTRGENAWEEFKDELEKGWNDIKSSFDGLRKRFS